MLTKREENEQVQVHPFMQKRLFSCLVAFKNSLKIPFSRKVASKIYVAETERNKRQKVQYMSPEG